MKGAESIYQGVDPTGFHTLGVISKAPQFNRWMYETIKPFLKGQILEIGSGIGNISDFLVDDGYHITLSDYNTQYCKLLKEKYHGRDNVKNILSVDLQHPDFNTAYHELKEKFDTIFLLNVIEHLQDDQKAVQYCNYLLKPHGTLVLLAPAYQFLYCGLDAELGHFRRYKLEDLSRLVTNEKFSIVHKQYFNTMGLLGWFVSGKIAGNKTLNSSQTSLFNRLVPLARIADKLVMRKTGLSAIVAGEKL